MSAAANEPARRAVVAAVARSGRLGDDGGCFCHPDRAVAALVDLAGRDLRGRIRWSTMAPFLDVEAFLQSLKRPICALPIALFALAVDRNAVVGRAMGRAALCGQPGRETAGAAGAVLSFRTLGARPAGVRRLSGILHAVDGDVLDRRVRSRPVAEVGGRIPSAASSSRTISTKARNLRCARWRWPIPSSRCCGRKEFGWRCCSLRSRLSFVVNMAFVIVSRTALVTMPIMLAVFALLHLKWRSIVIIVCAAIAFAAARMGDVAALRWTVETFVAGLSALQGAKYSDLDRHCGWNSGKSRCGFLPRRRCSAMARDRPAACSSRPPSVSVGAAAEVIGNPHNQTLECRDPVGRDRHRRAVRDVAGCICCCSAARAWKAWIGLLVVVQNIFTSLFNSHMFDFHEGWMYVLGVGIAGGMVLKASSREAASGLRTSVKS